MLSSTSRLKLRLLASLVLLAGCGGPRTHTTVAPAPTPNSTAEVRGAQSRPPANPAANASSNPLANAAGGAPAAAPAIAAANPPANAPAAPPANAPGTLLEAARAETFVPADIDELEQRFYVYGNALPARYAVDWFHIRFNSLDRDGTPLPMIAQVFVPRAPGEELPVYDFGPGTTGLKEDCAPSHEEPTERNWGDFEAHLLSFASQGYVAVMPDYAASKGPDSVQYYYIKDMHARSMLDAARAALRFTAEQADANGDAKAANAIFLAGYSQGGHAAYAARDEAAQYAPDLRIKGAVGYGPRGDVSTMLEEAPYLAPYLFYVYARVYGPDKVPVGDLLVPTITRSIEADVTAKCIDEAPAYYGDYTPWIYQPDLDAAVDHHRLDQQFSVLKQLLDSNNAGTAKSDVPVLILQGLADTLVTPDTQRAFVRQLCANGASVTFNTYEDIPHVLTRQVSYRDTLNWMAAILANQPPRSDCTAH